MNAFHRPAGPLHPDQPDPSAPHPAASQGLSPTPPDDAPTDPSSALPASSQPRAASAPQPRNPLHGVTLQAMVEALHGYFGWQELGRQIPVRCFQIDPSVSSSLKFLRKTPWAREKVESLYLFMLRDQKRQGF
jgi:hypothetical protein